MSDGSRRELARFLRSRRERVTPAEVGLPAGPRRRSVGLRREEVAVLAGLSPTWYTYLEQGRDIHPSAEVLDSLARVLGMSEDERRYMHVLAHGRISRPQPLTDNHSGVEIVRQLVATAKDSPLPVYAVDLRCDLVAWNPAVAGYYADFGALPPEQRNLMRWMLEAPEAKERFVHWAEDVHDTVARWRASIATQPPDERTDRLIERFRQMSPHFAQWWDSHDVREHRSRARVLRHPRHGEQAMRLIVVQAPDFAPCVVVFHVPLSANESGPE